MDDVYRDRQDPALTVRFELDAGERILAWTTTPWTLPSNLALAVGPDIDYAVMEEDGVRYILAEARLGAYERELADAVQVGTLKGSELVGRHYTPLFPFFADTPNAFQVLGRRLRHRPRTAPASCTWRPASARTTRSPATPSGIPTICPMDEHGRYTAEVAAVGRAARLRRQRRHHQELKERGVVVRHDSYNHRYPHCWRCAEPLVYRAISSWFVKVTEFRDRMVELNQQIHWVPEHVKDGSFGKWLANARDWSISRNRFWGSPIPVWRSDDPAYPRIDVYGSIAELERDFGVEVDDLHRPTVDDLVRPNPDDPTGRSTMRRVPEVLDCWFESGSMPFAQVHYPFENARLVREPLSRRLHRRVHRPDPRLVLHAARAGHGAVRPAGVPHCVSHGIVLGDDGQKMSKRLQQLPRPDDGVRHLRRRRDALVPAVVADPARRRLGGHRERHPRHRAPRGPADLEHVLLPHAVRQRRRHTAQRRTDSTDVLDRYILGKTARPRRRRHRRRWTTTTCSPRAARSARSSTR